MKITTLRAKDIMKTNVIKVYGSMTTKELARLFEAEHISGAPVVEGADRLIGVVSETDLVRFEASGAQRGFDGEPAYRKNDGEHDLGEHVGDVGDVLNSPEDKTVEDIMTPWTVSAYEDAPLGEIAKTMIKQHIHRVFVTDRQAHLKGIITTMDLVRVLAEVESNGTF